MQAGADGVREDGLEVPFTPIAHPSDVLEVRERIKEVFNYVGSKERLYFSARMAVGIALLELAGQMQTIITPGQVKRYLDRKGYSRDEEAEADGQS